MAKGPPLNTSELERIKVSRAAGKTYFAISKELGRDPKTVKKACLDPEMTTQIERVKGDLADRFEDVAVRMLTAISDKDIKKINAYQRVLSAAISTDKVRLLTGLSTQNVSISSIVETIEREEREVRERRANPAREGTVPEIAP